MVNDVKIISGIVTDTVNLFLLLLLIVDGLEFIEFSQNNLKDAPRREMTLFVLMIEIFLLSNYVDVIKCLILSAKALMLNYTVQRP